MATAPLLSDPASAPPSTELLATVAHELRTPLATLHATLEVLGDLSTLDPADAARFLYRLQRAVGWMDGLVDNLTTWTSLQSGHLVLNCARMEVLACIEPALALVQPLLERKEQHVRLIYPEVSPVVSGDARRLGQVVVNLLSNASTYSPEGDVIDLVVFVVDERVKVQVTDHGPGIPLDEQPHIFGRFTRGTEATHSSMGGLGLGLYIVQTLVELQGGRVGLDSIPGQGASFWFRLPCLAAAPSQPARPLLRGRRLPTRVAGVEDARSAR